MSHGSDGVARLEAFVDSNRSLYLQTDLVRCGRGVLFGVDAPRLPAPPLLAFDKVLEVSERGGRYGMGYAIAAKTLDSLGWVFDSHFADDPVMPGSMMLDGLLQLTGFFAASVGVKGKGRAARIGDIRFLAEVHPADLEILYIIHVKRRARNTVIIADGVVVAGAKDRVTDRVTTSDLWIVFRR